MKAPLSYYVGITPSSSEEQVLRELLELGLRYVGADEGSLLLLREDEQDLVFAMTAGPDASATGLIGKTLSIGEGLTGLAVQTGDVQIGAPIRTDLGEVTDAAGVRRRPAAVLAAPMHARRALVGVMTAISFDPNKRFGPDDANLCGRLANVAGLVIELRKRLNEVEGNATAEFSALTPDEKLERDVVDAVANLVAKSPDRLPSILALLRAAASLAG